ncbi:MAG TPA: DUF4783 domain-containing protein [Phaeodactylibacter sp.]|nr:DUF4783 domain-containing protein [Phaeodactylibacter sp.]
MLKFEGLIKDFQTKWIAQPFNRQYFYAANIGTQIVHKGVQAYLHIVLQKSTIMKYLMIALLTSTSFFLAKAQSIEDISKAIKNGDANTLAKYFDADVELTILEDVDIMSKQAAKKQITIFFQKNKPTAYTQLHKGTSKGQGGQYSIGKLSTSSGTYRVYIYLRVDGDKKRIQELRFEK